MPQESPESRIRAWTWILGGATWLSAVAAPALLPYAFIGCFGILFGSVALLLGAGFLMFVARDAGRSTQSKPGIGRVFLGGFWALFAGMASGALTPGTGASDLALLAGAVLSWGCAPWLYVSGLRKLGERNVISLVVNGLATAALGPAAWAFTVYVHTLGWSTRA